jgi:inward rectifier potassium channel
MRENRFQRQNAELQAAEDSGFGKKFTGSSRIINSDGSFNIDRNGATHNSVYEHLINVSWPRFFSLTLMAFVCINAVFSILYWIHGIESLNGKSLSAVQDFLNCFYFSIQTFTSVGYGFYSPQDNFSNLVASVNAFVGLVSFALATGMLFSRFSKARVNIEFSHQMLITPFNDGMSLQMRMVNANNNTLMNMEATANLTWLEEVDGVKRRKFHRLKLELEFIKLFPLNWTLVHVINEESPLWGKSKEELVASNSEVLVMVRGYDDTYNQYIYRNMSYHASSIEQDVAFAPMYETIDDKTVLYIEKIGATRAL